MRYVVVEEPALDQSRCLDILDMKNRRPLKECLQVVNEAAAQIPAGLEVSICTFQADEVCFTSNWAGRIKPVGLSNDPARQGPAIALSDHEQLVRVNTPQINHMIDAGHDVLVVKYSKIAD